MMSDLGGFSYAQARFKRIKNMPVARPRADFGQGGIWAFTVKLSPAFVETFATGCNEGNAQDR